MECSRKPVFVIKNVDEDIDLSLPPVSGEEYIKRVVIEAQQCADVVVANIDHTRLSKPTIHVEPLAGCIEAPPWLGPTLQWQMQQISDFSQMRLYVTQLKDDEQTFSQRQITPMINLPDLENEAEWIKFCSDSSQKVIPTLNIVFRFNQPMVEQILEYLVGYIETEKKIDYHLGQWLYALLVILEMPLNPSTCACLRDLARICSVIRVNSTQLEAQEVGGLNLFICLVARYFRQLDLADP